MHFAGYLRDGMVRRECLGVWGWSEMRWRCFQGLKSLVNVMNNFCDHLNSP